MRPKKNRGLSVALLVVGVAILALGATLVFSWPSVGQGQGFGRFQQHRDWDGRAIGPMGMGRFGFGPAGGVILLAVGVLLVGALARPGRWRPGRRGPEAPAHEEDALVILRLAYAEGRISEAEYRSRLVVLRESRRES
jgi:hypothetical protein